MLFRSNRLSKWVVPTAMSIEMALIHYKTVKTTLTKATPIENKRVVSTKILKMSLIWRPMQHQATEQVYFLSVLQPLQVVLTWDRQSARSTKITHLWRDCANGWKRKKKTSSAKAASFRKFQTSLWRRRLIICRVQNTSTSLVTERTNLSISTCK